MSPAVPGDPDQAARALEDPAGPAVFPGARPDAVTLAQIALLMLVAVALAGMGGLQIASSVDSAAWGQALRGAAFALLGVVLAYLAVTRVPVGYVVKWDPRHGAVLEVRRRWGLPVRLSLGGYADAVPRRVVFPWFPIVSGSRSFGLRGARVEEAILGFWSFGCNGRKAVVLLGPGRPATLVSPRETERFVCTVESQFGRRRPVVEAMFRGARLTLEEGDITRAEVDAVVNAANSGLMGGGGVDGAIRRAGGPSITEECRVLRSTTLPDGLPTGEAVSTTAGRLPARRVIHTVGPVWAGGDRGEAEALARAYRSCLRVAREEGLRSVAFPAISTGAYGYPVADAARVALSTVRRELEAYPDSLDSVRFVLHGAGTLRAYELALAELV